MISTLNNGELQGLKEMFPTLYPLPGIQSSSRQSWRTVDPSLRPGVEIASWGLTRFF